ncbi:GntR family transcriptional regulator [Streptomyces sp. NBC_00838]|uniref:GntR family transcriptional regulator n=1 Tax=Streptomyces sp. NBC_00838 TaxID=2903680 RepID=UPI00386609C4
MTEARAHIGTRIVLLTGESWSPASEESHSRFIEKTVRGRLADGVYAPGSPFPSLRWLAEEFGVSVATVRIGLHPLKKTKILDIVGNRTFVSGRVLQLDRDSLLECSPVAHRRGAFLSAHGESKCLNSWAKDPRCAVDFDVLKTRVVVYGWDLERALAQPKSEGAKVYEAFGDRKTLREWNEDSRCQVSLTTLRSRIEHGWSIQSAIQSPLIS